MYKQKGVVEIVLVLLLVAALGVAGYFYLQGGKTTLKPPTKWFGEDEKTLKDRIVNTPTPDSTANRGMYTNAKYGFSIQYPGNRFYEGFFGSDDPSQISFDLDVPNQDIKLKIHVDEDFSKNDLERLLGGGKTTPYILHDKNAFRYRKIFNENEFFQPAIHARANEYITLLENNKLYTISFHADSERLLDDKKELIDQILSTFKFID